MDILNIYTICSQRSGFGQCHVKEKLFALQLLALEIMTPPNLEEKLSPILTNATWSVVKAIFESKEKQISIELYGKFLKQLTINS